MENVKAWSTETSSVGILRFQWVTRMNGAAARAATCPKKLWTHSVTFRPDIFTWEWFLPKCRNADCDSVTRTRHHHGINKGVTGDMDGACDITASRGAYHLTVLHIYSVLLGIFSTQFNAWCVFFCYMERITTQYNKVSKMESWKRSSALKKLSELREPIILMRHLLKRMCSSYLLLRH